jgi:peptide/nickel transport system substrate-binding protein
MNHPDEDPPDGWRLEPEIAAAMPEVSADGKTYTFTIREGYAFSPPSNEPITAETIRYSIERAMAPGFGPLWTIGNDLLQDVKGASPFAAGLADHVEGLVAEGDRLTITLQAPAPDLLQRLALPFYCPVPTTTPIVENGVNPPTGLPSAGPYYLARKDSDVAILRRNPNYQGPRRAVFDNVGILLNQDVSRSIAAIEAGDLDYVLAFGDDALDPDGTIAAAVGPRSGVGGSPEQRYFNAPLGGIWYLNVSADVVGGESPLLADASVRQAIAYALDRPQLAALLGGLPTDQLLPPSIEGFVDRPPRLDGPDLERATELMAGRSGVVGMVYEAGCDLCHDVGEAVRDDLAAIGIEVRLEEVDEVLLASGELKVLEGGFGPYTDPARFLDLLPTSGLIDVGPEEYKLVGKLGPLVGQPRVDAAAALAERWAWDMAIMAPIAYGVTQEYFAAGIGCQVFPPRSVAVDLVALCQR